MATLWRWQRKTADPITFADISLKQQACFTGFLRPVLF
jgi:hypothetical protein